MGSNTLILFTNTYPFGCAENFLDDEIKYIAKKFSKVFLFPLYLPKNASGKREVPSNVIIMKPLLKCDHKEKIKLIKYGLFNFAPSDFAIKELFAKKVFLSLKKIKIFLNYLLIERAAASNKKVINSVVEISQKEPNTVVYCYWGDKSALLFPLLKKRISRTIPLVCRFHGSDIFEEAKGYLPFRNYLYPSVDYAIPVSERGKKYICERYNSLPKHIQVFHLGSNNNFNPAITEGLNHEYFTVVSCSNIIGLKRVELIANAIGCIASIGKTKIKWIHFGDGPMRNAVEQQCTKISCNYVWYNLAGNVPHKDLLSIYASTPIDLFINVSTSEGVPVSLMEAISFGIPIIATDVGGTSELFTDRDTYKKHPVNIGSLLPVNISSDTLKEEVDKYINMPPSKLSEIRNNARNQWEKHWNAKNNYNSFAELLKNLSNQV